MLLPIPCASKSRRRSRSIDLHKPSIDDHNGIHEVCSCAARFHDRSAGTEHDLCHTNPTICCDRCTREFTALHAVSIDHLNLNFLLQHHHLRRLCQPLRRLVRRLLSGLLWLHNTQLYSSIMYTNQQQQPSNPTSQHNHFRPCLPVRLRLWN